MQFMNVKSPTSAKNPHTALELKASKEPEIHCWFTGKMEK